MSDIFSVLQSAYAAAPTTPSNTKYTAVDPASFQGSWTGTYANNQKFDLTIANVNGFRAQVKYQSGSTVQYAQVLIGNGSSFRIGNSKIRADGRRQGHGRQRGDRSRDRHHQPGPGNGNPQLSELVCAGGARFSTP
jgi:hypothetical protein